VRAAGDHAWPLLLWLVNKILADAARPEPDV
jgi:hypothetical protein